MIVKSLTVAAFILGLGVVAGCDDSEVEDKIASILLNGAINASAICPFTSAGTTGNGPQPESRSATYTLTKLVDDSCFINVNDLSATANFEYTSLVGRSQHSGDCLLKSYDNPLGQDLPSYPDNLATDYTEYKVDGGDLVIKYCDNRLLSGGACIGSCPGGCFEADRVDIETQCTGFNLEVFE
jgi:hypothetical protein